MKSLKELKLKGKRVFMRVDFNVPLNENLEVVDDTRLTAVIPTINYICEQGAKLILLSHLGRPKGEFKEEFRLEPVAKKLNSLIEPKVEYVNETIGEKVEDAVAALAASEVLLLENVRFYKEEKENDPEFAQKLADLADVYVNDGFAVAHRAHTSVVGVPEKMEEKAMGLLLQKEIESLTKVLDKPEKPVAALIGGAKISTKIALIEKLLNKTEHVMVGGALANTILLAQGKEVGKSLVEKELAESVKDLSSPKLLIPLDVVVAKEAKEGAEKQVKAIDQVEADDNILDIGPKTVEAFSKIIKDVKTVIWNGPMGLFEIADFAEGTNKIAQAVVDSSAYSIIGGGETVEAVKKTGNADQVSFISTGGGAMLEFLEGKELPGIKALN